MDHDFAVTGSIIGCAIEVHRALGPGLKEEAYEIALCTALTKRDFKFESQQRLKRDSKALWLGPINRT
jgi:GxxExxY protein